MSYTNRETQIKIEITIYIGDADKNILFSSINMKATGIGQNENKAFINALNELEQDGEIQSVYSSKIYDGEQIRTIFKINENKCK